MGALSSAPSEVCGLRLICVLTPVRGRPANPAAPDIGALSAAHQAMQGADILCGEAMVTIEPIYRRFLRDLKRL